MSWPDLFRPSRSGWHRLASLAEIAGTSPAMTILGVMAGLVPAISLRLAPPRVPCRDCRDKPGNDNEKVMGFARAQPILHLRQRASEHTRDAAYHKCHSGPALLEHR